MKNVFMTFCLAVSFLPQISWAEVPIRFGVYKLKGVNPDGIKKYDGRVVIEKEGNNYRVTWFIGEQKAQSQTGIGLLKDKVLSIGYMDHSGQDFGAVSLKVVSDKNLRGHWASMFSKGTFGEEEMTFESEKIPLELRPSVTKPPASRPERESI
jgi:hypothetical protein